MENIEFFGAVKRRMGFIVLAALFVGVASFLFLIFSQEAFKVRTDFLVTQSNGSSQDFYAMSRSSEYVGKVLSEAIYSERFLDAVVETGKVSASSFPMDKNDKLERWSEEVRVNKNLELGMIQVEVFHDDQKEAVRISQAIADVLTQKNHLFRGGEEKSVEVRVLTGPITENNPSVAQLIMVAIGGFLFGGLLSLAWIFMRTEMFPKRSEEILIVR
ncbi:MAG: hypothetical protein PHT88_00080 [Candidatus Moranbacteria bacterium]|nr:hypothetical protein [Candidatus Moranbacteria bacterium]